MSKKSKSAENEGSLKVLASALLSRFNIASRLGLQFGGSRDLYEVYGYKTTLSFIDYLSKYSRQDIAARVIDAPAMATWREAPTLKAEDAAFTEAWDSFVKDFPTLWHIITRADKLAGLGQLAAVLVGFDDGGSLQGAVRPKPGRKVIYMQPIAEDAIDISKFETSPNSPRFGLPVEYELGLGNPQQMSITSGTQVREARIKVKVHHSRVLHIVENVLEDPLLGQPRLARVYNLLDDMAKVAGGSAETFWLTANRGIQADIDKEMELDTDDAAALSDQIDDYQHQLRRVLRTRGVKINTIGSDTPDPTGVFKVLISLLAGATGIPQRILLGAEAGQLASEQDRANWADRISERQTNFANPSVLIPLINLLSNAGVLPQIVPFEIMWGNNFYMSPLEVATKQAKEASATINYARQKQAGMIVVDIAEAREALGQDPNVMPEQPVEETNNGSSGASPSTDGEESDDDDTGNPDEDGGGSSGEEGDG